MKLHERRLFLGWFVGWFYYMILALDVAADTGPIAFPFQAVIGAVFSVVGVGMNGTVLSRCAVAWTMHDLDVVTPWSGEQ